MDKISRDMTIAYILETFADQAPQLTTVMQSYGLHCVGCHASTFETLEQGVLGHGLGEDLLNQMLENLNEIVKKDDEQKEGEEEFHLTVTDSALERMRDLLSKEDTPEKSLRVKVIPGGCAGASYDMQFVLEPEVDDIIFHVSGFKMFIDKNSASLLQGLEIGYVNTMMESRFTFENPNASGSCGCGTSFDF